MDRVFVACHKVADTLSPYTAMPTFDASELQGTVATPDRLISDAHKILTVLAKAGDVEAGDVTAALTQAVAKAEAQWALAREARMSTQASQAQVREGAIVLNRELVALRRILRAKVGTRHIGYQLLRVSRAEPIGVEEEENTIVEDEAIDPVTTTSETPAATNGASSNGAPKSVGASATPAA